MDIDADALDPTPSLDFALIADAVQAVAGKLYVMGGGWDNLYVSRFPARHHTMGIGMRFRVPWAMADDHFAVSVDLVDEDGTSIFGGKQLSQRIPVRRPPYLPVGGDMPVVRAFTLNNLPFAHPGGYAYVIRVGDKEVSRVRFWVRERPGTRQSGDQEPGG